MKELLVHLKKEIKESFFDYLVFMTASIFFLVFLRLFRGQRFASYLLMIMFVSFYILWGIFHHRNDKALKLKNVIEYIFIGFSVLILLTVILTA